MLTKTQVQQEIVELSKQHKHVLVTNATGTGKTLSALQVVKSKESEKPVLILLKERLHKNNWLSECEKHGIETDNLVFACYASLKKFKDGEYNLVLDEVHALSEKRAEILKTIKADFIVSLSATVNFNIKVRLHNIMPYKEYHISTSEAIENKLLPEPKIFVVDCWFDNKNKTHKYVKTKGKEGEVFEVDFKKRFEKLKALKTTKNYSLSINCTESEYYVMLTEDMEYYKKQYFRTKETFFKTKWLNKGSERKHFIAECKNRYLKTIISKLNNERFLCFCGSIKQANEIGNNVIHSEIPEKVREELISKFNAKQIDQLYTVQMLKEGMNLTDCKYGIITQLDNFELSFIQRLGRVLRHDTPVVFVLIMRNSQDEKYFDNVFENFNMDYVYKLDNSWKE